MNSHVAEVMHSNTVLNENNVALNSQKGDAAFDSGDFLSDGSCTQEFVMTPTILLQLCRLERYECRAILRRRRAMRAFLAFQPV
jgi:hypothetical protein